VRLKFKFKKIKIPLKLQPTFLKRNLRIEIYPNIRNMVLRNKIRYTIFAILLGTLAFSYMDTLFAQSTQGVRKYNSHTGYREIILE